MIGPAAMQLEGPSAEHASAQMVAGRAVVYATPRIGHLRHALRSVPTDGPRHLVDYGCGKGRVLLAAREEGYDTAVGVELSAPVCADAHTNMEMVRRRRPDLVEGIDIINGDATSYPIRPTQNVFYFYNPFGPAVLTPVLDAIAESVRSTPRPAWVLYLNHVHRDLFDARPELRYLADITSQHYKSALYLVETSGLR